MDTQESNVTRSHLTKWQKRSTYIIICVLSLLGGIEYALILPTLYLRLQDTYHAPTYFLGMVLSAFSFSGLFASPIMGRIYDQTHSSKLLVAITITFEIAGSLMYWMGISPWFLLGSRLVAGIGNGFYTIALAEVTHGCNNKDRTSVISTVLAARQFGLLVGPGFNLFLSETNFYIGPFSVDKYSSPGLFMVVLWLIALGFQLIFYHPMTQATFSASHRNDSSESIEDNKTFTTKEAFKGLVRDDYMAIFMLTFVALFNQTGVETFSTPVCNLYLGWDDREISLMFCAAGVIFLVSFLMVNFASKRFTDRQLVMFGLLCELTSTCWYFWILRLQQHPGAHLLNSIILMSGFVVNVFGSPFLFVCHISLFSKLLHKNIQGTGQGVRRTISGIAAILGPLWCGSLINDPLLMVSVMVGLNVLAFTLVITSYKNFLPQESEGIASNGEQPSCGNLTRSEPNERTTLMTS